MSDIPKFVLFGEGDVTAEEAIQPALSLRQWSDLTKAEKEIALRQLRNRGWIDDHSTECLQTISYLNYSYLRQCPGIRLHKAATGSEYDRLLAAATDFADLFLNEKSDALVLRMLSKFSERHISYNHLKLAKESQEETRRKEFIVEAFEKFDRLANCLNHIFEQFAVNHVVTRNGFVPRQDDRIVSEIYVPTLKVLADPKWAAVSADLAGMFEDHRHERYAEVITKAHSAVQRFLQISVGEEGKSGKGELAKLFKEAKEKGIIPNNRFIEPVVVAISSFIPSERATNSTAKPALKQTSSSDAMLMMNVVVVLLQYCLQNMK